MTQPQIPSLKLQIALPILGMVYARAENETNESIIKEAMKLTNLLMQATHDKPVTKN